MINNNLDAYSNNDKYKGRIGLFNSFNCSIEKVAKFENFYEPYEVATTQNKVNSYVRYFE